MQQLRNHIYQRLLHKIELGFNTTPLNLDYFELICRQELYLLQALSNLVEVHPAITQALQDLFDLVKAQLERPDPCFTVEVAAGATGRPKILIGEQRLKEMLHNRLPVSCIAKRWVFQKAQSSDEWKSTSSLPVTCIVPSVMMNLMVWLL